MPWKRHIATVLGATALLAIVLGLSVAASQNSIYIKHPNCPPTPGSIYWPSTGGCFAVAPTVTAASCSAADVQTALNAATASGSVVAIPAGTCSWTTQVTWTAPANAVIEGAGTSSAAGGANQTIIIDDYASGNILLDITTNATGTFRLTELQVKGVSSLTWSAGVATAVTSATNNFQTGDWIRVSGATPTAYNGLWQITVTNGTTFTYNFGGSPSSPATGTITAQNQGWVVTGGAGPQGGQSNYSVDANATINIVGTNYNVASVTDATHLTLSTTAGTQTGVNAYILSGWDSNATTDTGYPCMDDVGRGQGQLLNAQLFPNRLNTVTSTVAWPNQALEPIYEWSNTFTAVPGWGNDASAKVLLGIGDSTRLQANRDYYQETGSFNGTVGVGVGTLGARPATCTTGVGYFATDQGSWNTSTSNPQGAQRNGASGLFYKCTATNTWTLYYTPYTYPHPLNAG